MTKEVAIHGNETMSHLEVADITGKQARHVTRDLRSLEEQGVIDLRKYKKVENIVNAAGQNRGTRNVYYLPARIALTLISGYDALSRSAIIDQLIKRAHGIDLESLLDNFDMPDDLRDRFVYVAKEKGTNNLKVGISIDPEARIKQLNVGNPRPLELLVFRHAPNGLSDEKRVHSDLESLHIRGEWFTAPALTP